MAAVAIAKQANTSITQTADATQKLVNSKAQYTAINRSLQFSQRTANVVPQLLARGSTIAGEDSSNQVSNLANTISGERSRGQDLMARDIATANYNAQKSQSYTQIGGALFGLFGAIVGATVGSIKGGKSPSTPFTATIGQNLNTGYSAGTRNDPGTVGSHNFLTTSAQDAARTLNDTASTSKNDFSSTASSSEMSTIQAPNPTESGVAFTRMREPASTQVNTPTQNSGNSDPLGASNNVQTTATYGSSDSSSDVFEEEK